MVFVAWVIAILLALTVHEFAHAWAANLQGDPTSKLLGRLTLNPLKHIDNFGFICLLLVGFGWGKPVPINPVYFKNKKLGDIIVSLAGSVTNFIFVFLFAFALKMILLYTNLEPSNLMVQFFLFVIMINVVLGVFNLIPIPPLDGSHILLNLLPSSLNDFKYKLIKNGPWILLAFIFLDRYMGIGILSGLFNFFFVLIQKIVF